MLMDSGTHIREGYLYVSKRQIHLNDASKYTEQQNKMLLLFISNGASCVAWSVSHITGEIYTQRSAKTYILAQTL